MKVGYYKTDLFYTVETDSITDAAETFAEELHQIDGESDMKFTVYVEDCSGVIHTVKMYTEYDPSYYVDSVIEGQL